MTDAKVMAAWAQVLAQPKVAALRLTPAEWEAAESIFEAGYRAGVKDTTISLLSPLMLPPQGR